MTTTSNSTMKQRPNGMQEWPQFKAELAYEQSEKLSEMAEKCSQEHDCSVYKAVVLAKMCREVEYEKETTKDAAEQGRAGFKADNANYANPAPMVKEQSDAFALKEIKKKENSVQDRESAPEKEKFGEVAKRAGIFEESKSEYFNPFEGRPLDKNFPKTPINFHGVEVKGEEKATQISGKTHEETPKPFNP